MLPRGLGRSYGDSCLNDGGTLLDTTRLGHMIEFDRDNNELLLNLAQVQARIGDTEAAERSYRRLLERLPTESDELRAQVEAELRALTGGGSSTDPSEGVASVGEGEPS